MHLLMPSMAATRMELMAHVTVTVLLVSIFVHGSCTSFQKYEMMKYDIVSNNFTIHLHTRITIQEQIVQHYRQFCVNVFCMQVVCLGV